MSKKIALLVTCLVDVYRPSIAFAAVKLLEKCGYEVEVPMQQTCCGQPNYNSGDRGSAKLMARNILETFANYEYIVTVSGSCGGMLIKHYPLLFADDLQWESRAKVLASKVYELSVFLTEIGNLNLDMKSDLSITYHDGCSGLRELGIREQPRQLLGNIAGLTLVEMQDADVCCGFGGAFSVKYPDISNEMVIRKVNHARETRVDSLVAGDLGCILNMEGKLNRMESDMKVYHYAELLANSIVAENV